MNILVSACLLGLPCRYDGRSVPCEVLAEKAKGHTLIPFCPEIYGGLPTPRDPAERVGDRVLTRSGADVTEAYRRGAQQAVFTARLLNCAHALLKEKSPSCGCGLIYDGTFSRTLAQGNGLTAQLLMENGVTVAGESRAAEFFAALDQETAGQTV